MNFIPLAENGNEFHCIKIAALDFIEHGMLAE